MEILAPVGSVPSLKAAIAAGCNAVYLGLGEHNARVKCTDFSADNLKDWVQYAHKFGVKVYVTLNTMVKNCEFAHVSDLAKCIVNSGADAIIVADAGLASEIKKHSNVPVHISTQAGVQNSFDAEFFTEFSDRLILARETLDEDIAAIKAKSLKEIETFVQGAICVSFSGGCLLGSMVYGCSGNRGQCNQPCRLQYTAKDDGGKVIKSGYLLSPYDLCRAGELDALQSAGVDSIKIEGRLKRPVYVYDAVKYYSDVLSCSKEATADFELLKTSFNRGFTSGYCPEKSKKIIAADVPSHIGVAVGKVVKTELKNGYNYAYVQSDYRFAKGDGAKILRNGKEVGGSNVTSVQKVQNLQVIPVSDGVQSGDTVHLTTNAAHVRQVEALLPKIKTNVTVVAEIGKPLVVTMSAQGASVTVQSDTLLAASVGGTGNEAIVSKLTKLGGSDFIAEKTAVNAADSVFLPVGEVNALRREACEKLSCAIVEANTPDFYWKDAIADTACTIKKRKEYVVIEVDNLTDVKKCAKYDAVIYTPREMTPDEVTAAIGLVGDKLYLRLPKICREADLGRLENLFAELGFKVGVYADNHYAVTFARRHGLPYIAGFGLNVANVYTASLFNDAVCVLASAELKEPLVGAVNFAMGKLPLMHFAHCPFSVVYGNACADCTHKAANITYHDGTNTFDIRRYGVRGCNFALYGKYMQAPCAGKGGYYGFVKCDETEKELMWQKLRG